MKVCPRRDEGRHERPDLVDLQDRLGRGLGREPADPPVREGDRRGEGPIEMLEQ